MKTYTCNVLLQVFYDKADVAFKSNFESLDNQLPKGKLARDAAIKVELRKIRELLRKFDSNYATVSKMH